MFTGILPHNSRISIHALLAESDPCNLKSVASTPISIHALLAESDLGNAGVELPTWKFLSTLSLRRATGWTLNINGPMTISIHALLAESDNP